MLNRLRTILAITAVLALIPALRAQDSTATENFDDYGDMDGKPAKTYCTQKVLYLSPTKLISIGYEAQLPYTLTTPANSSVVVPGPGPTSPLPPLSPIGFATATRGLRLAFNTPVVSRSNFILNLGLTYWNSAYRIEDVVSWESGLVRNLEQNGLRSTGLNATLFKPFDNKRFLIAQANADLNGDYRRASDISGRNMTYSATAIYGWKKSDNLMWGLGVSRTYRAGALLYVPVLFYNRTFNQQWGVEVLLPARASLRRNFGTKALLLLGYELEGNAYYLSQSGTYLRRGELKPRITFERQIKDFVWLSVQAGLRYNWRFDAYRTQNPQGRDEKPVAENRLGNPLYFNVSLNLVSP